MGFGRGGRDRVLRGDSGWWRRAPDGGTARSRPSGRALAAPAAIVVAATGCVQPEGRTTTDAGAAPAATLATVGVDLGRSQGTMPFAPGRQLSAIPKSPLTTPYGPATLANLDRLDL